MRIISLAHHRWVYLNGIVTPSFLNRIAQAPNFGLADVEEDIAASGGP